MARELTAGDVAARNGIDRKTAWRWLRELHAKYPELVIRRGARGVYVTTEAAFASVAVLAMPKGDQRIAALEERIVFLEGRIDELVAEVTALYRRLEGMK